LAPFGESRGKPDAALKVVAHVWDHMLLVNRPHVCDHFDPHDALIESFCNKLARVRLRISGNPNAKVEQRWRLLSFKGDPVSIQSSQPLGRLR
jgi:hypothetical protein